jgi:hypothetical protein
VEKLLEGGRHVGEHRPPIANPSLAKEPSRGIPRGGRALEPPPPRLAALAIPGVGPFITAGALASALGTTGGALAAGAIVGGTSGAIAGGLSKAGYTREESEFYGPAVERGGVLVAVETGGAVSPDQAREVLTRNGGRTYGR